MSSVGKNSGLQTCAISIILVIIGLEFLREKHNKQFNAWIMTAAASGDAWRVTGEDRAKHDGQFFSLKPVNGYITGEQARGFFMQSGLPTPVLGQIWSLADMNNDGKMDKKEFSIAMHLIKKRLQGYEIPKSLPPSLRADPSPVMGSFGTMGSQASVMGMAPMGMPASMGMGARMPMMANGMAPMVPAQGFPAPAAGGVPVSAGFSGPARPQGAPNTGGAGMAMPHGSKLKYTQMFNTHDHSKRGTLTGVEARSILMQTGVPQQMLAQIWNLSDIDKDGKLDCEEFCIAMHLIDLVKMGQMLPAKLPPDLMPNKVRSGSFGTPAAPVPKPQAPVPQQDSFGDLLGNMGMPPPVQPAAPVTNGDAAKIDEQVTFEDRRKENFDKGQAELERRRQMLQEQMKKEEEARLQKERDEQEKRDKIRREQEMKKQQALERQLEKQREIERQKEEQRQKMMEQREAARRELERQRQMEWERQRKEQLMAEKIREYEQLTALKAQSSNLKCELESLQGKKTETTTKISQVKNGLNDLTAHIEAMKSTRDLKNKDIDRLQTQIQEFNQKYQNLQSDKSSLDLKVQTSIQSNPMSETHRTMMHSVELKKTSVQRLKKDIESIEKDTGTKLADIDTLNTQIADLQKTLSSLQTDISDAEKKKKDSAKTSSEQTQKDKDKHEKLRKELESQRLREEAKKKEVEASKNIDSKWFDFGSDMETTYTTSSDNWVEETKKKEVEASKDMDSKWFDFGGDMKTTTATSSDNWASVFDTQAVSQASSVSWDSAFSSQSTGMKTSASSFKLSGPQKKYKALYQFDARNPDELSMMPGDIIMVFDDQTGAEPEWIGGELNGKRGWFPEAYVEKLPEESSQSLFGSTEVQTSGLSSSEDSSFMAVPGKVPAVSPTPGQGQTAPEGLQAQALYPWKAKKDNHLTFNKGDIINVKEQQDMWWSGEFAGKTGWFPKSYVKMVSGPSISTPPVSISASSSPMLTLEKADSAQQSPAVDTTQSDNLYVALYTYQSSEAGDLTFNQGDVISVSTSEGDWWTGTLGSVTGIFPANYVKKQEAQSVVDAAADPFPAADTSTQNVTDDPFVDAFPAPVSAPSVSHDVVDNVGDGSQGSLLTSSVDGLSLSLQPNTNTPTSMIDPSISMSADENIGFGPQQGSFSEFTSLTSTTVEQDKPTESTTALSDIFHTTSTDINSDSLGLQTETQDKRSENDFTMNNQPDQTLSNVEASSTEPFPASPGVDNSVQGRGNSDFDPFPTTSNTFDDPFKGSESFGSFEDPFSGSGLLNDPFKDSGFGDVSGTFQETKNSSGIFGESTATNKDTTDSLNVHDSTDPWASMFTSPTSTVPSVSSPVSIESLERDSGLASYSDLETKFGSWGISDTNTSSVQTVPSLSDLAEVNKLDTPDRQPVLPPRRKRKSKSESKGPPLPPKTYLENVPTVPKTESDPNPIIKSEAGLDPTSITTDNQQIAHDEQVDFNTDDTKASSVSGSGTLKKPEIATVIAAYTATGNEQLSLSPGQLIQVRKKSPSGWWEGELQARGQKRKIGWFPANYVKLLGSSARNTPDNTLTGGASPSMAMFNNSTPTPVSQSTTPQPPSQNYIDHVIALYPYAAQNPDELTFQKDAVINVTKKDDPDWWQGECNGQMGMFPSNYVTSNSPESTSWSSDPQVIAMTSQEEAKRQSYIHELINTEETYMKDMSIVLEAFYKPLADSGALSEEHLKNIFVNWKELIVCNTKLQKALRVRKKMCGEGQVINSIGDILCENIPHLTPYIRFCSCQLNAAALLQRLTENNSLFNEVHKKCVQNPKTKGMPLSSFLLKPMQRITKYPLIVEKILCYTPEGHPDHNHLREALEHCQELCSQVNEGVREKENSDRLEWIQQHVHCDGLPEKITFNSVTNCLGPRKILHTGVVYKAKSNKELGAFLFNDFLLLTTSNRPLSNATHSLFDVTGQVQYKMYKTPVFLNEVMIKKSDSSDDDGFVVSHIDRVYHLRCHGKSDRDVWLKHLNKASSHYLETIKKKREKAYSSPKHSRGVGRLLVIIIEGNNLICSKDVRRSPGVGRLLVVILEGKDLQPSDANGKSDPYCEVSMGVQEHKTKVINNSLNPKWNASMQFTVKDLNMDALCITVFDRDLFSPNDFLGRTEIRIQDILKEAGGVGGPRQPLVKKLVLHEVPTGEIVVKLDLHLFEQT